MLDLKSPEWAHLRASPGGNGALTADLLADLYAGETNALVDPYSKAGRGRRLTSGPPFKPCVRFSRTRLTDGLCSVACDG